MRVLYFFLILNVRVLSFSLFCRPRKDRESSPPIQPTRPGVRCYQDYYVQETAAHPEVPRHSQFALRPTIQEVEVRAPQTKMYELAAEEYPDISPPSYSVFEPRLPQGYRMFPTRSEIRAAEQPPPPYTTTAEEETPATEAPAGQSVVAQVTGRLNEYHSNLSDVQLRARLIAKKKAREEKEREARRVALRARQRARKKMKKKYHHHY